MSRRPRSRSRRRSPVARAVPWLFAALTVALEIAYPLVEGRWLDRVTIATVVAFAAACISHAVVHRGLWWALRLAVVTLGGGLAAEAIGVRTGLPFGNYTYADSLGPKLFDVPLLVPLAWTMMAYPVLLAARRLTQRHPAALVPVGAFGLMAWDVFLDPQMVGDGHWTWADPTPALPGVAGIPLTNFAGWLGAGALMMLVLAIVLPRNSRRGDESVPAALLIWTWVGYVVGNVFWFGSTSLAVVGGVLLGAVVVPYAWSLWQARP